MNKYNYVGHNTRTYNRWLPWKRPLELKWYEPPLWRFKNFSAGTWLTTQRKTVVVKWKKGSFKTEKTDARYTPVVAGRILPFLSIVFSYSVRFAEMACGATLKRSMEFEALLSPQSPKRRRCNPLTGSPSTPSPQRYNLRPPLDSPTHSTSPLSTGGEHRLTPGTCRHRRLQRSFSPAFQGGWHGGGGLGGVES